MKYIFTLVICLALHPLLYAQATYAISGTVTDTTGAKIQSATVFIAGSEKMTMTNNNGVFNFTGINPGNYLLVVNMLGYNAFKQAITLKDHSESLDIVITGKRVVLNEVVIDTKKQSPKDLKRFKKFFLGYRYNSQSCKILNPEQINFVHTDTALTATSNDFLIIENLHLGYRIKYLLKSFFCKPNNFSFFDGDFVFEPLSGTVDQQKVWDRNRKTAYEGSMMHFLRALYAGTTRKEGFLVYKSTTNNAIVLEPNPTNPEQFLTRDDSGSVNVNISPMVLIVQNRQKAAQPDIISDKKPKKYSMLLGLPYKFTLYKLTAKVDNRGSITDRSVFYSFGYWGIFGVSDQLPFEYKPE